LEGENKSARNIESKAKKDATFHVPMLHFNAKHNTLRADRLAKH